MCVGLGQRSTARWSVQGVLRPQRSRNSLLPTPRYRSRQGCHPTSVSLESPHSKPVSESFRTRLSRLEAGSIVETVLSAQDRNRMALLNSSEQVNVYETGLQQSRIDRSRPSRIVSFARFVGYVEARTRSNPGSQLRWRRRQANPRVSWSGERAGRPSQRGRTTGGVRLDSSHVLKAFARWRCTSTTVPDDEAVTAISPSRFVSTQYTSERPRPLPCSNAVSLSPMSIRRS